MAGFRLNQLRWVHAAPLVFLAVCLTAMWILTATLAAEIREAHLAAQAAAQTANGAVGGSTTAALAPVPELSLPSSFEDACALSLSLSAHLRSHPSSRLLLLLLFASVYLLKQTFSIPGSALLNIMAGFIFGVGPGVPLVAFLTAVGASGCYALSSLVGSELLKLAPSLAARTHKLQLLIEAEKRAGTLFVYLLVLRVFPFTPNFFVNLAAPLVGIPFPTFFLSALLGLVPYVYITVTAGDTLRVLSELQQEGKLAAAAGGVVPANMSLADVMDAATMAKLALLALSLLLPIVLKRLLLKKNEAGEEKGAQFKL